MTYDRSIRPRNSSQVPRWLKPEDKSWNHETYVHLDSTTSKAVHVHTIAKSTDAYCFIIHDVATFCDARRLKFAPFRMVTGLRSDITNTKEAEHD